MMGMLGLLCRQKRSRYSKKLFKTTFEKYRIWGVYHFLLRILLFIVFIILPVQWIYLYVFRYLTTGFFITDDVLVKIALP